MSDIAIRIEHLGKMYRIGAPQERYRTLRDTVVGSLSRSLHHMRVGGSRGPSLDTIWALDDVSFDVKQGEVVGIIGRNGAGKSTLLKILSRITEPTRGRVRVRGRVGSLLEVGTGFHPELTGRENIYLNGAILGMRRAEIERKFDEIVAFAEIEKFLDTPVKRYSSGMYVRLAFAVAAHLEPEILVVDEVLAVGDAQFQKKCLGKMGDVAHQGRTVLFVTHNMVAVQSLCSRALCMNEGRIVNEGSTHAVVASYMRDAQAESYTIQWDSPEQAPGTDVAKLHMVRILTDDNQVPNYLTVDTPFWLETQFWNHEDGAALGVSLHLFNQEGVLVLNSIAGGSEPLPLGLVITRCRLPAHLLNDGFFVVTILIFRDANQHVFWSNEVISFEVHDSDNLRGQALWKWPGTVRPSLAWQMHTEPAQVP